MDDTPLAQDAQALIAHYAGVYERLHARWERHEHRPSPEAVALLQHLQRSGPLTVAEATQHFDRAQSAMSELFDRLEARGLLVRFKDQRDRRRTLVWLSEAGGALLDKCTSPLDPQRVRRALLRLSPAQRAALLHGLAALAEAADDSPPENLP